MQKRLFLSLLMLLAIAPSAQAVVYMSEKDVDIVAKRACKMHDSGLYTRDEVNRVIDLAIPQSSITDTFGHELLERLKRQDGENINKYESQVLSSAKKRCGF